MLCPVWCLLSLSLLKIHPLEAWLVRASAPQQAASQESVFAIIEDAESPVDAKAFDQTLLEPGDGDWTILLV